MCVFLYYSIIGQVWDSKCSSLVGHSSKRTNFDWNNSVAEVNTVATQTLPTILKLVSILFEINIWSLCIKNKFLETDTYCITS